MGEMRLAAVFLDRDGTIIEDQHYPRDPKKVTLLQGAVEGLMLSQTKGYTLFVVSNQSGVGRGIIRNEEFRIVHNRIHALLENSGIRVAQYFYCFHKPEDACSCRKPRPGLLPTEFQGRKIDFSRSYTVGDKACDVLLSKAIGAHGALVLSGNGAQSLKELQEYYGEERVPTYLSLREFAESIPDLAGAA